MKTIANCTPAEFLKQSWKLVEPIRKLMSRSRILDIRKNTVDTDGMTADEAKKAISEQSKKNLLDMVGKLLEEYPTETAEIMGLMCFIEPAELDEHNGIELLLPCMEILKSKAVVDFFSSLAE